MLKLFAIDNTQFSDAVIFENKLSDVDEIRRTKIEALIPAEKKYASLAAGIILPLALKECGVEGAVKIEYEPHGKPRLVRPQGVFFNISHSGKWTVIALSDSEVGVDVQQIRPVDLRVAARFFTDSERELIENCGDGEKLFYRIWTIKEAYLKASGEGLNRPLNSFEVKFTGGGVKIEGGEEAVNRLVSEFDCFTGYNLACVAGEYAADSTVEILSVGCGI